MAEKPKVITMPVGNLAQQNQKHFKKGGAVKANAKPKMSMKKMGKK
jgi:hypothetical protein